MPEPDLVLLFTRPLDALGIAYMVTGSVAGILYGEPRVTHDVDVVVELPRRLAARAGGGFSPGGERRYSRTTCIIMLAITSCPRGLGWMHVRSNQRSVLGPR